MLTDNKRIYKKLTSGTEEYTFYGARGEKLGVYSLTTSTMSALRTSVWFAGKLISENGAAVFQDRVGTNRASGARFRPYGDEITSTANDREKFGTYTRDGYTGLDYADQRYYASSYGRLNTADPLMKSAKPRDPGSWNRYSYTVGDPINRLDKSGLDDDNPDLSPDPDLWYYVEITETTYDQDAGEVSPAFVWGKSGNAALDAVRQRIYAYSGKDTLFGGQIVDCIAGLESSWNENAVNGNFAVPIR